MKKTVFILIVLLVMASSLTAGTLAMYTTSIDGVAQGSVAAKEFVFTGEGSDSFAQGVKIAPSETVTWQFDVSNYSGAVVTETDLYYKLTVNVRASEGKKAIAPLTVTVRDQNGDVVGSAAGVGKFDVLGEFPLAEMGQSHTYTVEVHWPSDDSVDFDYAGGAYGTSIHIDALASQAPLSSDDPDEPQTGRVSVLYQTTAAWQNGQSGRGKFNYSVTITNNSDKPIEDWAIDFALPYDRLVNTWSNAKMIHNLPRGQYRFVSPNYNNPATDSILPGQSVTFGGRGEGWGYSVPQNVRVSGSNVDAVETELSYELGIFD